VVTMVACRSMSSQPRRAEPRRAELAPCLCHFAHVPGTQDCMNTSLACWVLVSDLAAGCVSGRQAGRRMSGPPPLWPCLGA